MISNINWWDVATTVLGAGIVGIGTILYRKVNEVLGHVEKFSIHIMECELRNKSHKQLHDDRREEINRRLNALEALIYHTHLEGK